MANAMPNPIMAGSFGLKPTSGVGIPPAAIHPGTGGSISATGGGQRAAGCGVGVSAASRRPMSCTPCRARLAAVRVFPGPLLT